MKDELFDRARDEVKCEEVAGRAAGCKLFRVGKEVRGICPFGRCGAKSGLTPFRIYKGGRRWKCYSCDPRGGDVVDLEHRLFSGPDETIGDAARRLIGGVLTAESEESRARRAQASKEAEAEALADAAWRLEMARKIWRGREPAAGSLVQVYLESRAIRGPVLGRMLMIVGFNPRTWHSGDPERGVFLPAMISLVMTELGPTGGVHCTYLSPNGRGKTHRTPKKRMLGPQGHFVLARRDGLAGPPRPDPYGDHEGYVLPGGIWLTRPDAPGPLVTAEGIENTASRAMMVAGPMSFPVRAVAAGSLDRLSGFELVDDDGVRDVWKVRPDPWRPGFSWPEDPASPWGLIDVAVDGDMSPVTVKGRAGLHQNRLIDVVRDSAERARVSGALAKASWRRRLAPESTTEVRASCPPIGMDFNEVLMAAEAAASVAGGVSA
ncbi:DUF7146 domain-containing protein [Brevundimonas faecalis]|uniref:DUF7146 domain-containing protein n=1 Tax=Brevundimonas faecalis TaxID=947378 RepID=A0ABV2RCH6_9CAUL